MGKRGPKADWRKADNEYEYQAWRNALNRGVVPEWESFATFLADMGPREEGHALFRRDTKAVFGPKNCGWAPLRMVRSHSTQLRKGFRPTRAPRSEAAVQAYIKKWGPFY